jgi:hypothetical protein
MMLKKAVQQGRSEEVKRYAPHFVGPFALVVDLGERKSPSSVSDLRKTLVEPPSDARTKPGERRGSARRGWAGEKSDFSASCLRLVRDHAHTKIGE